MNALSKLYNLRADEGFLTWEQCNRINQELVAIKFADLPKIQHENVADYLVGVLTNDSAQIHQRPALVVLLDQIRKAAA